ncbi:MAG: type II toxin-antitoxin system HicB family antitoxin [Chloroflexota bacterium]
MTVATPHYAMIIDWSEADQAYLVTVPDLPGCRTHGESYTDAAQKGQDAIDGWVELQVADGRPLPAPAHTGIGEQFDPLARLLGEAQAMASGGSPGPAALSVQATTGPRHAALSVREEQRYGQGVKTSGQTGKHGG